jgi:hypothetical protein
VTVIREFFALLGLETEDSDFKEAENALDNIVKGAAFAVAAVSAIGAAFGVASRDVIEQARELDKWNRVTDESIERLDALGIASRSLGVDAIKTFEGMTELADRASDVVLNIKELTGDAGESFKSLGFRSVRELRKTNGELRDIPELFDDVLTRLSNVENVGERTGIAMRLFGDDTGLAIAGIDIDKLRELRDEALELGLVMSRDDVQAAQALERATGRLFARLRALRNQIVIPLLPALTKYADELGTMVSANADFIETSIAPILEFVADAIVTSIRVFRDYAKFVGRVVELLGGLAFVSEQVAGIISVLLIRQIGRLVIALNAGLVRALARVNKAMFLANLQALLAGAAFLLLLIAIDEIVTTLEGGDSLAIRFLNRFNPRDASPEDNILVKTLRLIVELLEEAGRLASDLVNLFTEDGPIQDAAIRGISENRLTRGAQRIGAGGTPLGAVQEALQNAFFENVLGETPQQAGERVGAGLLTDALRLAPSIPIGPGQRLGGPSSTVTIESGDIVVQTQPGAEPLSIGNAVQRGVERGFDNLLRRAKRTLEGGD